MLLVTLPTVVDNIRDTRPAACAEVVTVTCVFEVLVIIAGAPLKRTLLVVLKFNPLIVTIVFPAVLPWFGLKLLIIGLSSLV